MLGSGVPVYRNSLATSPIMPRTAESVQLALFEISSRKVLSSHNAAQLPEPGLCKFCSTEVWGDRGWRRLWRKSAFTGKRVLKYRQSYGKLKRSANQSCFLCGFVYKHTEDKIPGRNDEVPEHVSMCIYHYMPSRVTPGTCAELLALWVVEDINAEEIFGLDGCLSFGVSTVASDPAALYYLAPIPICGPYSNFESRVAQKLLENCHQTHEQCRSPSDTRLPNRLLDCGEARTCSHVRIREIENGKSGQYTALSYAWGNNENLLTVRDNLLAHTNGIDVCALPNTVKDAVQVTRALDLRYLWVDALCIIQDSAKDKIRELERMSEYYRNAYCVIGASASRGADEGFLKPWHRSRRFPMFGKLEDVVRSELDVPFLGPAGERGTITLNIASPQVYQADQTPLSKRGWALQERLLCSRYLHFPVEQGFALQCDHEEQFAGKIVYSSFYTRAGHQARRGRSRMLQGTQTEDGGAFAVPDLPIEVNEIWQRMMEEYSSMTLSITGDRLMAIAGLAESYHKNHEENPGSYFAGHWRGELVESLSWFTESVSESRPVYRAPSWSWASLEGQIGHWTLDAPTLETIDIIDVGTTLLHPSLPFGAVTDGYLIVQGRLHRTLWRLGRSSDSKVRPKDHKAGLLLPKLASVDYGDDTWFDYDGSHWLTEWVWRDTLQSPTALAEPVDMLLLSSHPYNGTPRPLSRVLLLQKCGKDAYQRIGFASLGTHVDHDAIFQGEKTTIRII